MNLFLLIFILVYSSLHLYFFIRLIRAFRPSKSSTNLLAVAICCASLSPLAVRALETYGFDTIAIIIAWPGYIWMGFIFIFTVAMSALHLISILASIICTVRRADLPVFFRSRLSFETALLLSTVITCYGLYEARSIRSQEIRIYSDRVSAPTRIVQLSDVHLGLLTREERLKQMLKVVNRAKPDILVSTGDLVDGRLSRQEDGEGFGKMITLLKDVKAPLGKFAITGNHEYYAGLEQSIQIMRASGFKVLRNEYVSLPGGIAISGVDDPAWKRMKTPPPVMEEQALLNSLPDASYRIHLKHRPVVAEGDMGRFDLQLSGHTHQGQIFPFYLLTKFQFPIPSGTTDLQHGSRIHVSRGSGTWGPPIRFLAPPEVTVIDIVPAKQGDKPS